MPDTITAVPTPEVMRDAYYTMSAENVAPWAATMRRWFIAVGGETDGEYTALSTGDPDRALASMLASPSTYSASLPMFATWCIEQGITAPDPVSPAGGQAPVITIDEDTPGWNAWWEELAEHAREAGYISQYNQLAEAMGADEIDDEDNEERDFYVDVRIEAFTVSVHLTSTRNNMNEGEYELDEGDVDEAIRDHIRNNSVDYSTEGWEEA